MEQEEWDVCQCPRKGLGIPMATGFCLVVHIPGSPYILCDSPKFPS